MLRDLLGRYASRPAPRPRGRRQEVRRQLVWCRGIDQAILVSEIHAALIEEPADERELFLAAVEVVRARPCSFVQFRRNGRVVHRWRHPGGRR